MAIARQRPVHLSVTRGLGGSVEHVARLHADWALGLGRFSHLRDARLEVGVPGDARADDHVVAGTSDAPWVFRVGLPVGNGVQQTSAIRVRREPDGVVAEHLVVWRGPAEQLVEPQAIVPEVVPELHTDRASAERVEIGAVDRLVSHAFNPARTDQLVLVSMVNRDHRPLVDPEALARLLTGVARVLVLPTPTTSLQLTRTLERRGLDRRFGCYDGGVRILRVGLSGDDDPYDHPLILGWRSRQVAAHQRVLWLAGTFVEVIADDHDIDGWLREAGQGARKPDPVPPPSKRVAPPSPRHPADEAGPDAGDLPRETPESGGTDEPDIGPPVQVALLHGLVAAGTTVRAFLGEKLEGERADSDAALELAEETEGELNRVRDELDRERRARRRGEQQRDAALESKWTINSVADALMAAEVQFDDKLVILSSAHQSARDSSFRKPELVHRCLVLLALFGDSDSRLPAAVGTTLGKQARWKPKDGPETVAKFGGERIWVGGDGHRKLFSRHLTLGHGLRSSACLQIYYDILGDGRIEVAWVGEHRRTVSQDT